MGIFLSISRYGGIYWEKFLILNLYMFNLYNPQFDYFGLDISTLSLKLIYFKKKKGKYNLISFGSKNIPKGLIRDGQITDQEKLASIIKSAIKEVNGKPLKTKYVSCSLPEEKSFIRVLTMPEMTKEELENAVQWEAEANIPLPIENVYLNWQVVPSLVKNNKMEVVIAASPKNLVDNYLGTLEKAGLFPVAMEMESIATIKSVIDFKKLERTRMIVDIGATRTSLIIFAEHAPRFTTNLPVFGQTFDEELMKKLKLKTIKQAEDVKLKNGFGQADKKVFSVMHSVGKELKSQIEKHINFCQEELGLCQTIEEIILVGGGAQIKGILPFMALNLKRKVVLGDPWVNIGLVDSKSKKIPSLSKLNAASYSTAIGLAM